MNKREFEINLYDSALRGKTFEFDLNDHFFTSIEGIIERGNIHTEVQCFSASSSHFEFSIHSEGYVIQPCDRCLSDIELRINTEDFLEVGLGDCDADNGDILYVSEKSGLLDISIPIYEFIALSLPLRLVHSPGMCDEDMMAVVEQHLTARSSEDNDDIADS